jgi:hypothetical protein
MSRTQAEYYAYTPRTQFNSKEVRESEIWNWRYIVIPNDNEQINFMNKLSNKLSF